MPHQQQKMFLNIYLLLSRIWLGYSMIMGGQSILHFFSSKESRDFFENWFGKELGLPAPLLMAVLAKGTEFFGGILILVGLFTRISASLVAIVMGVATLVANLSYHGNDNFIKQDGLITISCFLFAVLLIITGAGKYSVDTLFFSPKIKPITREQ